MSGIAKGHGDGICAMYHNSGRLMWNKIIGGYGTEGFNSVTKCTDGSFVTTEYTGSRDVDMEGTIKNQNLTRAILFKFTIE